MGGYHQNYKYLLLQYHAQLRTTINVHSLFEICFAKKRLSKQAECIIQKYKYNYYAESADSMGEDHLEALGWMEELVLPFV